MKKLLLLGALLASTAMQAQENVTLYYPNQRVQTLEAGRDYFIYNTAYTPAAFPDRSWFIFSTGSGLNTDNTSPKNLLTTNKNYIFQLEKPDDDQENHWYMKSGSNYVGIAGVTNNSDPRDLYITKWYGNESKITHADVESEQEDGTYADPDLTDTYTWTITIRDGLNQNDGNNYAWNGSNMNTAGIGNAWTRWSEAHPYAFYTVETKELPQETWDNYQKIKEIGSTPYNLQKNIGLIQSADQLSTNAQEQTEGPIANLIDGNETTYFHSAYNDDPSPNAPHYIQVELSEAKNAFYFYTKKRSQNNNNRPTTIKISVSTDGSDFQEIQTISEGLIAADSYMSPKISSENPFKYVRFEVTATNTNTHFFTYSEFYMYDADLYEAIETSKASDYIKNTSVEEITTKCNDIIEKTNSIINKREFAELQSVIEEVESTPWGDGLNQFKKPTNYEEIIQTAKKLTSGSPLESIQNTTTELNNLLSSKEINQPATGKFYRFKSATLNNYISSKSVGNNNRPVMTGNPEEAIFYLTSDYRLITENLKAMNNYNVVAALGEATTFKASKAIVGTYAIRNNGGSYYATETGSQIDRHGTEETGLTTKQCAWTIEEVETPDPITLNKNMSTSEYATLGAPVALNIPRGVKAYTVTVSDNNTKANLNEITSGIIPAGCGVVLKAESPITESSSFNFTFNSGADVPEITEAENALRPLYVDTKIGTDITAYILANENNKIGFYLLDANEDNRTVGANKAYLVLPQGTNAVRSILFGGPTTGIENTVATDSEKEEYYDLQGRRVMNPEKGIYITKSGKKVIFTK